MKGKKSVPCLPGSSRLQMPSGNGATVKKTSTSTKGSATKKVMSMGKSKGILGSSSSVKQKGKY